MYILNTKYGSIGIEATQKGISKLILNAKTSPKKTSAQTDKNILKLVNQLDKYFQGKKVDFIVSLDTSKYTDFYQKVWKQARKIPYGKTSTYGEIAKRIGHPKASRAVGQALGANPLPIIIPCHRVLRKDKSLGGFAYGLEWKKRLLELERATDVHG